MLRNLPFVLGVIVIVGLTAFEIQMTDRLSGTNVSAEQRAELLEKVPINIGDWHGEDKATDPNVRKTAGAIGAVSRSYRNSRTGEQVDLWLIVGHAREVSGHTPDICYPAAGFSAQADENSSYTILFGDNSEAFPCFTNTFRKEDVTGQHLVRVFWSWFNPVDKTHEGKVTWETSGNARWHFGNTRALYKMYFTSMMRDPKETADLSACVRFAKEFLPEVNKALSEVYNGPAEAGSTKKPATAQTGTESKAGSAAPVEKPASENAATEKATADKGAESATKAKPEQPAKAGAESKTASPGSPENDPLFATPKAEK
jgi:hypothetical protein